MGLYFPYFPVDEAIQVRMDPVENSVVAALESTHSQESNTRKVEFIIIILVIENEVYSSD